jgi:hypothetical protein
MEGKQWKMCCERWKIELILLQIKSTAWMRFSEIDSGIGSPLKNSTIEPFSGSTDPSLLMNTVLHREFIAYASFSRLLNVGNVESR